MKFIFGFVLLFVCSTAFANEHNRIASKLMQTQNCSFDINRYSLSNVHVQTLRTQQLETLRNVNQITESNMQNLVQQMPALRLLSLSLIPGLRFGNIAPVTRPEDIQLGTGSINFRKSIQSTSDVLKRFGQALNKIVDEWKTVARNRPNIRLMYQRIQYQHALSQKLNQIIHASVIRMWHHDFRTEPAFHHIVTTVLHGFFFGPLVAPRRDPTIHGIGALNTGKSLQESYERLNMVANGLIRISIQWDAQLVGQKQSCESYLRNTFAPRPPPRRPIPTPRPPRRPISPRRSISTTTSTTVSTPVSGGENTNRNRTIGGVNIDQLVSRIFTVYNVTSFPLNN